LKKIKEKVNEEFNKFATEEGRGKIIKKGTKFKLYISKNKSI